MSSETGETLFKQDSVDRGLVIPLYYQIAQILRHKIESGELAQGEYIPTEKELQGWFEVSRSTVRRAISELVYAGLLERRRPKGTIVAKPKLEETLLGFGSFTTEMIRRGMTPESHIIEFGVIPAPDEVAGYLEIDPEQELVALKRIRTVDNEKVAVELSYFPAEYVPGINQSHFTVSGQEQSTYHVLHHRFGIYLERARDTISAVALQSDDAKLLEAQEGMPVMRRTRIAYDFNSTPMVYSNGLYIITLILELNSPEPSSRKPPIIRD